MSIEERNAYRAIENRIIAQAALRNALALLLVITICTLACAAALYYGRDGLAYPFGFIALVAAVIGYGHVKLAFMAIYDRLPLDDEQEGEPGVATAGFYQEQHPTPIPSPLPVLNPNENIIPLSEEGFQEYKRLSAFVTLVVQHGQTSRPDWTKAGWTVQQHETYIGLFERLGIVRPPAGRGAGRAVLITDVSEAWRRLNTSYGFNWPASYEASRSMTHMGNQYEPPINPADYQ